MDSENFEQTSNFEENTLHDINDFITDNEISRAIKHMKNKKAPGPDGVNIEVFKLGESKLVPLLNKLYNGIMQTEIFPKDWSKAIIFPLHKKGDKELTDNYRGISLLDIVGKIFTKILNARLVAWAEDNNLLLEEQNGFRKGRSTIDSIFCLMGFIQKYICKKKGRFYCLFVDFSKAFDTVQHLQGKS